MHARTYTHARMHIHACTHAHTHTAGSSQGFEGSPDGLQVVWCAQCGLVEQFTGERVYVCVNHSVCVCVCKLWVHISILKVLSGYKETCSRKSRTASLCVWQAHAGHMHMHMYMHTTTHVGSHGHAHAHAHIHNHAHERALGVLTLRHPPDHMDMYMHVRTRHTNRARRITWKSTWSPHAQASP
jgi:hypothetical protein